jgi:hypothetical protein
MGSKFPEDLQEKTLLPFFGIKPHFLEKLQKPKEFLKKKKAVDLEGPVFVLF